jgi:hypothetical protein
LRIDGCQKGDGRRVFLIFADENRTVVQVVSNGISLTMQEKPQINTAEESRRFGCEGEGVFVRELRELGNGIEATD